MPQGPWTDIYALGVVAYECVTGEKPPEVLERMHGGLGKPLAEGNWPGYGKKFLAAIDAAMAVKPDDRPQSISEWLAMFGESSSKVSDDADEATRFFANEVSADEIMPVAPPEGDFEPAVLADSRIPADPNEVQFKRAGEETGTSKKLKKEPAAAKSKKKAPEPKADEVPAEPPKTPKPPRAADKASSPTPSKVPKPALIAGGVAALLVAAVGGWAMFGRGGESTQKAPTNAAARAPTSRSKSPTSKSPSSLRRRARSPMTHAPRAPRRPRSATSSRPATSSMRSRRNSKGSRPIRPRPRRRRTQAEEMKRTATAANVEFANALLRDAEARANRVSADVRWSMGSGARTAEQRSVASRLSGSLADLRVGGRDRRPGYRPGPVAQRRAQRTCQFADFRVGNSIGLPGGSRPAPHSGSPAAQAAQGNRDHDQDDDRQDSDSDAPRPPTEVVSNGRRPIAGQIVPVQCDRRRRPRNGPAGDAQSERRRQCEAGQELRFLSGHASGLDARGSNPTGRPTA